jgi:hypothetical protein
MEEFKIRLVMRLIHILEVFDLKEKNQWLEKYLERIIQKEAQDD